MYPRIKYDPAKYGRNKAAIRELNEVLAERHRSGVENFKTIRGRILSTLGL